jgi:hypothetical protein
MNEGTIDIKEGHAPGALEQPVMGPHAASAQQHQQERHVGRHHRLKACERKTNWSNLTEASMA